MKIAFTFFLILFTYLSNPNTTHAESKKENAEIYEMAKSFATCSALYDAYRDIIKAEGDVDTSQVFNDMSNGAELVAGAIAKVYGGIQNQESFVAGIYDVQLPLFKSIIKNKGPDDPGIAKEMEICKELYQLQGKMVEEIRKKAYGADTSNNVFFK